MKRILLQYSNPEILHYSMSSSDPTITYQPMNDSVATAIGRPFKLTAPFDSSMALTILVLLTALFFMGFFSIYIRHFAGDITTSAGSDEDRRRRNLSLSSSSTSAHRLLVFQLL